MNREKCLYCGEPMGNSLARAHQRCKLTRDRRDEEWKKAIISHSDHKDYHQIEGIKATCLDMVILYMTGQITVIE